MKHSIIASLFGLLGLTVLFSRCTNQPLEYDNDEIPFKTIVQTVESIHAYIDTAIVYYEEESREACEYAIIGKSSQQECRILVKFSDLPDSAVVQSAEIHLTPVHVYGSPSAGFTASAHTVLSSWSVSSTQVPPYDPTPVASFVIDPSPAVTDDITLPAGCVQDWIDALHDPQYTNYGLLLSFETADFAKQYKKYPGISLTVIYTKNSETDTVSVHPAQAAYIPEGPTEYGTDLIVSNFGNHRIKMKFDISSVTERSVVSYAELIIPLDMDKSMLGIEGEYEFSIARRSFASWDTLGVYSTDGGITHEGALDLTGAEPQIRIEATRIVQRWISDHSINYGLRMTSLTENTDLSLFGFYDPGTQKQPYLMIQYVVFNPF